MKTRLDLNLANSCWRIVWIVDDGDGYLEEGAELGVNARGRNAFTASDLAGRKGDQRDVVLASMVAQRTRGRKFVSGAFAWWTKSEAQAALRCVRAALREDAADPRKWPQWSISALASGWKPPKGWKP